MTIAQILTNIASKLRSRLDAINVKLTEMGQTAADTLDDVPDKIAGISTGIDTSDANATAEDILAPKSAYVNGVKIEGTIQTKDGNEISVIGASVTIPSGYYAEDTEKSLPSATQAIPSISINSSGLVTATSEQDEGYVMAGTTSETYQVETYTMPSSISPGKNGLSYGCNGKFVIGNVIVQGDANLVSGNIKSGVSIFGVQGSYSGSSASTSDATAGTADVRSGKTFYNAYGKQTGVMPTATMNYDGVEDGGNQLVYVKAKASRAGYCEGTYMIPLTASEGGEITPGKNSHVIMPGTYLKGGYTIKGDNNLVAANIKKGISIFGVTGVYGSGLEDLDIKVSTATINVSSQTNTVSFTCNEAFVPLAVVLVARTANTGDPSHLVISQLSCNTNGCAAITGRSNKSGSNAEYKTTSDSTDILSYSLTASSTNITLTFEANSVYISYDGYDGISMELISPVLKGTYDAIVVHK